MNRFTTIVALAALAARLGALNSHAHLIGDPAHDGYILPGKAPRTNIVQNLYTPPAGNGTLMASSFAPFKPNVRFF